MCLAVPFRIISMDGNEAVGEMNGIRKKIRIDVIKELQIGDYVMVHAGFAIEKLNEVQAKETIEALNELQKALEGEE